MSVLCKSIATCTALFAMFVTFQPLSLLRSGVLRTQKLKTHLLRSQSSKVLLLKPGAGPYIALHATPTAKDFFLANFLPFRPIHLHLFQNFSRVCPLLASADTGFCVIHQNKTGHPVHRYRQLMQIPALSVRGT